MWEPLTGVEHCLDAYRYSGGYVLLVDGEFYADAESMDGIEEEMVDAINAYRWSARRPVA